ncbi:MAG: hypothetical protein HKN09_13975 [Saprospiraceae bacterium]|nr:hypothetical protein [Saprospiraceae bacterium]
MSVQRGIQLGKQNVLKLSLSYLVEMVTRVVITVLLVAILCYLELGFYTLAVSIGFLLSFIATHFYIKESYVSSQELSHFTWPKEIIVFIALTGLYEFGQIIINNCDLILVKHFFESKSAGLYASLSLIGRMVFFATWSVVGLLIPHVIEQKQKGKAYNKILIGAVSFVGAIGGGITLSCFLLDEIIIQVAFGEAYLSISPLLWKYALATSFFACANVFAYFYMALDQYIPVVLTIVAGMIQALLIYFNHNSLENVVWMQILAMSGLFIVLNIYHIIQFILNEKIKISHRYSLPTR